MATWQIVLIIILVILIAAVVALTIFGRKMQKKQAEQDEMMQANKQTVSMLIIDKKRMRINESGLPQIVMDQVPKLMRRSKLPIVKAKVGPQVMSLIADEKIFDDIPVKKEVKAVVSGIYIIGVKSLRGKSEAVPQKKKSRFNQFVEKVQEKAGAKPVN